MKVIHLISGGDSGGAKTHVLSLLQNLNKTITAQLVCFRDGPFAEEARAMGIPTMICGGNNIPHLRRELADYIREGGYQLIHCHGSRANMIGALLRKPTGLPVVSTVHSDYKLDYMGRPFARLTFGAINAWALRHLDYRIGVSDAPRPQDRLASGPGGRCGRKQRGGGHRRPAEPRQGYVHPGPGLCRGPQDLFPAAAGHCR